MRWHPAAVPCVAAHVQVFTPADRSDTIVFDDQGRRWHRLPGTAAAIWASIDGHRTVAEIADHVAGRYDTTGSAVVEDITNLVAELVALGLVVEKG